MRQEGPILTLTLDHAASGNAQLPSLWLRLAEIGRDLRPDTRVVIIRANGPDFSRGIDSDWLAGRSAEPGLPELAGHTATQATAVNDEILEYQKAFAIWSRTHAVSIAAVQGEATGVGLQLALACDLRIVSTNTRMRMHQPGLGVLPVLGGTHMLVNLVGYSRALEICTTGREVGGPEATRIGLAALHVPVGELDEACRDLADAVLANSPSGIRVVSSLLRSATTASPEQQQYLERTAFVHMLEALRDAPE
ncbi:enoyl-CoA hydratase/isomerase family protein [Leekyejoonella antrihumi]|uniref:Enoyl-CoA hydratase/isomerase family protein n=2 Tax=Leekyejoonella antrihumi TaxID=1660198 RepID=A0A563E4V2_9MICO|nr:enoyl-CoA hydratase/isomerase family protein [Leekyejoonella antrihumi]